MDAAVAALVGAFLGGFASVAGVVLTQRYQSKRDLVAAAVQCGLTEFQRDHEETQRRPEGGIVPPPDMYIAYHAMVLRKLENDELTPQALADIRAKRDALLNSLAGEA